MFCSPHTTPFSPVAQCKIAFNSPTPQVRRTALAHSLRQRRHQKLHDWQPGSCSNTVSAHRAPYPSDLITFNGEGLHSSKACEMCSDAQTRADRITLSTAQLDRWYQFHLCSSAIILANTHISRTPPISPINSN